MKGQICIGPLAASAIHFAATDEEAGRIAKSVLAYLAAPEDANSALPPHIKNECDELLRVAKIHRECGRLGGRPKTKQKPNGNQMETKWKPNGNQNASRAQEETSSLISHAQGSPLERNTDTTVSVKERPAPLAHHADESAPAPVSEEPASPPPPPPPQPADFALTSEPTSKQAKPRKRFEAPTVEAVTAYCAEKGYPSSVVDPDNFVNYHAANGWMIGKNPMKDWKAAVRYWASRHSSQGPPSRQPDPRSDPTKFYTGTDYYDRIAEAHGLTYSSSPFTGKPQQPQPPSPPPPNVF